MPAVSLIAATIFSAICDFLPVGSSAMTSLTIRISTKVMTRLFRSAPGPLPAGRSDDTHDNQTGQQKSQTGADAEGVEHGQKQNEKQ